MGWMLAFSNNKSEARGTQNVQNPSVPTHVPPQTYPLSDPTQHPMYPTSPMHPTNPNHPQQNGSSNSSRSLASMMRNVSNRMVGKQATNAEGKIGFETSNDESEMRRGVNDTSDISGTNSEDIRMAMKAELEPLKKMFSKLKKKIDSFGDEGGFAKVTENGLEGEDLFRNLPKLGKKAVEVLKNPPKTWKKYLDDEDFESIYHMECKELKEAMEKAKNGDKDNIDKELTHVMASLLGLMMCECKEEEE